MYGRAGGPLRWSGCEDRGYYCSPRRRAVPENEIHRYIYESFVGWIVMGKDYSS